MNRFLLKPAFFLLLVLPAVFTACSGKHDSSTKPPPETPRSVNAARAQIRPLERIIIATGSLAAHEQATLSVKVPGRVESVAVDLGSPVNKGDLIAQLEQIDYELRQKQAA